MPIRRLILMRHATAAGVGEGSDHSRVLTSRGREQATHVGARLAAIGAAPDRVLSSSATRCRETAECLCVGLETQPSIDFEDALYNAGPSDLLNGLAGALPQLNADECLLLIAHNPGISMLAFELGRGKESDETTLRGGFIPATFAVFEVNADATSVSRSTARLIHYERPE